MAMLIAATFVVLFIAWIVAEPLLRERRRMKLRAQPFPRAWQEILDRRVPYLRRLPRHLKRQLEGHIRVFVAEKRFVGCDGLEVDDEVRVTIAAQACLLILNRSSDGFPNLRQILVYPGAFVIERLHPIILGNATGAALQSDAPQVMTGESWTQGQVVLSWEHVVAGAADPDDGHNVVIHEFAHQLDQQKGYANGAPWLGRRDRYPRWSRVLSQEYGRLQQQSLAGEPSLFSPYGATTPAEFFAVASEVFFERPQAMAALHPALYGELALLYRVNPAGW